MIGGAAATIISFRYDQAQWMVFGSLGFFGLGVISFVEAVTDYLVLDEEGIRFRKSFRSVQILKSDIEQVTWTKGGGTSVKREDGTWVMVPDMGYDSQGMTNSLKAWLRAA
jgi:hypothetical protein